MPLHGVDPVFLVQQKPDIVGGKRIVDGRVDVVGAVVVPDALAEQVVGKSGVHGQSVSRKDTYFAHFAGMVRFLRHLTRSAVDRFPRPPECPGDFYVHQV